MPSGCPWAQQHLTRALRSSGSSNLESGNAIYWSKSKPEERKKEKEGHQEGEGRRGDKGKKGKGEICLVRTVANRGLVGPGHWMGPSGLAVLE